MEKLVQVDEEIYGHEVDSRDKVKHNEMSEDDVGGQLTFLQYSLFTCCHPCLAWIRQ